MTNIYRGSFLVHGGGDNGEEDKFNNNSSSQKEIPVVLKILNQNHDELSLVSFWFLDYTATKKIYWWFIFSHHPFNFSFLDLY